MTNETNPQALSGKNTQKKRKLTAYYKQFVQYFLFLLKHRRTGGCAIMPEGTESMAQWKKAAHIVYRCSYHLVWAPRYRYRILQGKGTSPQQAAGY
jgi:hypothetical protein